MSGYENPAPASATLWLRSARHEFRRADVRHPDARERRRTFASLRTPNRSLHTREDAGSKPAAPISGAVRRRVADRRAASASRRARDGSDADRMRSRVAGVAIPDDPASGPAERGPQIARVVAREQAPWARPAPAVARTDVHGRGRPRPEHDEV